MKKCVICEKSLEIDKHDIVYGATVWNTRGNYGSTVYDPLTNGVKLECWICDKCLTNKKSLLEEVKFQTKYSELSRKEPNFDEEI